MRIRIAVFAIYFSMAYAQSVSIVSQVRAAAMAGDFTRADQLLAQYKSASGLTPEYLEAFSWIGRGQLSAGNYSAAEQNAQEVRKLCLAQLPHRKLDADNNLPIALGASIEVHAQGLAGQGRRDEAILFLRDELKRWHDTSMVARIQKNINLLTLTGKPAPPLEVAHAIGDRRPRSLAQIHGHPVLLFFWAHWCPDCKVEISVVRRLNEEFGPRGLVIVAPTQHYGYVAGGEDAPPDVETRYIGEVFAKYYSRIGSIEVPLSEQNFKNYGVSTTPTMVLLDGRGIVRVYNPGKLSYEALAAKIEPLLGGTT